MLKKIMKRIAHLGANLYSLDKLIEQSNHHVILPFYHAVRDENPIHIKNLYEPRSVAAFEKDLDFLLAHYESISLEGLMATNRGEKELKGNYFHLTFDDGLRAFYDVVAPILKQKNIHATVFLNSDFIDNKQLFFRFKASILFEKLKDDTLLNFSYKDDDKLDEIALKHGIDFDVYLKEQQPYLTTKQINELIDEGFTFGAHSKNHPLYKELGLEEQIIQTEESVAMVKSKFDLSYQVFSFPFTDDQVTMAFFDGLKNKIDLTFGCAGLKEDTAQNHFQRIAMETNKTGKQIIKGEYLYYLMKAKFDKHKIFRQ